MLPPLFTAKVGQVNNIDMEVSHLWRGPGNILRGNPAGKDALLLKHQIKSAIARAAPLLSRAAGGSLSLIRVK